MLLAVIYLTNRCVYKNRKKAAWEERESAQTCSRRSASSRSGGVESVVKKDTPVENVKVALPLGAGALCQRLHVFV